MPIQRYGVTTRYADSVVYAGTVYLVEVPQTLDADIHVQTLEVLERIEQSLTQAGSHKTRLILVTIYLRNMADYAAVNAIWDAWVPSGHAPARVCIEARLANPGYHLEITVVAAQ